MSNSKIAMISGKIGLKSIKISSMLIQSHMSFPHSNLHGKSAAFPLHLDYSEYVLEFCRWVSPDNIHSSGKENQSYRVM